MLKIFNNAYITDYILQKILMPYEEINRVISIS